MQRDHDDPAVAIRIVDAGSPDGPIRVVLSGNLPFVEISGCVERVGGSVEETHGRLLVSAVPGPLMEALGERLDRRLSLRLIDSLTEALASWTEGAPDLMLRDGRLLSTGSRTLIQGVLNVTPDSFSDGGTHLGTDGDLTPAIEAGRALAAAGADLIDVGGESTRPGSASVSPEEELARTVPVVQALAEDGIVVSIDTTKAAVARAAVDAGAAIVNDVSAGSLDEELYPTVAELGVPYVLMHMQGIPRTMQQHPTYDDVVGEVYDHLAVELDRLESAGVACDQVIVDPGIGFGKTVEHNLSLLRHLREITSLGRPVLVGASRKTFIGKLTGVSDPADRLEGSLAVAALAVGAGARIVRVHDVRETVRVIAVADAIVHGTMERR